MEDQIVDSVKNQFVPIVYMFGKAGIYNAIQKEYANCILYS